MDAIKEATNMTLDILGSVFVLAVVTRDVKILLDIIIVSNLASLVNAKWQNGSTLGC